MENPQKKIFHIRFPNYYTMGATLLRFQEYYESPRFRSRVFTLEDFMDWYADASGHFGYFEDWIGFNFPSLSLRPFYDGRFDPLTRKEKKFLNLFRGVESSFYVIATISSSPIKDLRHEMCHAHYYLYLNYRRAVKTCLEGHDVVDIEDELDRTGYHKTLFPDEANAYLITGFGGIDIGRRQYRKLRQKLRQIFKKHFGYWPHKRGRKFWMSLATVIDF